MKKFLLLNLGLALLAFTACHKTLNDPKPTQPTAVTITTIAPTHAGAGANITITGTGFSTVTATDVVKINGVAATVVSATATTLTVTVPVKVGTGPVSVTVNNLSATGPVFTYDVTANPPSTVGLVDAYGGAAISLNNAFKMVMDATGNIYLADQGNNRILKFGADAKTTVFAGNLTAGSKDGTGIAATFNQPGGLAIDGSGNLYVADSGNNLIREIDPTGKVTTIAGSGQAGSTDGKGIAASFNFPISIAITSTGDLYVTDATSALVRKIAAADRTVTTIVGPNSSKTDILNHPLGICLDAQNNAYVADYNANKIFKIGTNGSITTFAGSGTAGAADGTGMAASFNKPVDVYCDTDGTLYVTDSGNNAIRKITSAGVVTTFLGGGTSTLLSSPYGILYDAANKVFYVTDNKGQSVKKIAYQ